MKTTYPWLPMLQLRRLENADLPLVHRLTQQAQWNQTPADLARFAELSAGGWLVANDDGEDCGTVATFRFGQVAWIALMLVDESRRGRGIGRALMSGAIELLESLGVASIRLDATPLGQPLYESLGFRPQWQLQRFAGTLRAPTAASAALSAQPDYFIQPGTADDLDQVIALDQQLIGTPRGNLLQLLVRDQPSALRLVRRAGRLVGYSLWRPGAKYHQLGPCLALEAQAAEVLLHDLQQTSAGQPVVADVPESQPLAVRWAETAGLTVQRPLLRMCRGQESNEKTADFYLSAGAETG